MQRATGTGFIGFGLVLIVVGAILKFAVTAGSHLSWTFPWPSAKKAGVQDAVLASDEQERGRKIENQARQFAPGFGEVILRCTFG